MPQHQRRIELLRPSSTTRHLGQTNPPRMVVGFGSLAGFFASNIVSDGTRALPVEKAHLILPQVTTAASIAH